MNPREKDVIFGVLILFFGCEQASYESKQDIQLMRFADYFGRAFALVGSAQFPWLKTFKESPVAKLTDVSISFDCPNVNSRRQITM